MTNEQITHLPLGRPHPRIVRIEAGGEQGVAVYDIVHLRIDAAAASTAPPGDVNDR
ncbi:hypothetical protein [Nocardia brasiliensis]|uniref:hypothetical protein n=1 Tax=Nocardia brasiliensis TaxID=37326 RepID=UPI002457F8B1|nr:hypothetical protein [Nocardia brasiliensis]